MNDKRLKLAKEALESGSYDKETIEYIFPELKESEDEKIRKELIEYIKGQKITPNNPVTDEWIAWLEKQGKVKHTCRNCKTFQDLHQNCPYSPIYQYINLTEAHKHLDDETHCEFWLEKQGEQKPAWSEEDDMMIEKIIDDVTPLGECPDYPTEKQRKFYEECNEEIEWLKSIKQKFH